MLMRSTKILACGILLLGLCLLPGTDVFLGDVVFVGLATLGVLIVLASFVVMYVDGEL